MELMHQEVRSGHYIEMHLNWDSTIKPGRDSWLGEIVNYIIQLYINADIQADKTTFDDVCVIGLGAEN